MHLSYTLGSSEKQIVPEDKELFNLESRVEIEKSIKQVSLLSVYVPAAPPCDVTRFAFSTWQGKSAHRALGSGAVS